MIKAKIGLEKSIIVSSCKLTYYQGLGQPGLTTKQSAKNLVWFGIIQFKWYLCVLL